METVESLGRELRRRYDHAPRKEQTTAVLLFGLEHSEDVRRLGIREVIEASGLRPGMKSELNKGVNLARYLERNSQELDYNFDV